MEEVTIPVALQGRHDSGRCHYAIVHSYPLLLSFSAFICPFLFDLAHSVVCVFFFFLSFFLSFLFPFHLVLLQTPLVASVRALNTKSRPYVVE